MFVGLQFLFYFYTTYENIFRNKYSNMTNMSIEKYSILFLHYLRILFILTRHWGITFFDK